jgi:hypothetical protein
MAAQVENIHPRGIRCSSKEEAQLAVLYAVEGIEGDATSRLILLHLGLTPEEKFYGKQTIYNLLSRLLINGCLAKGPLAFSDGYSSKVQYLLTKRGIDFMQQNGLQNSPALIALASKAPAPVQLPQAPPAASGAPPLQEDVIAHLDRVLESTIAESGAKDSIIENLRRERHRDGGIIERQTASLEQIGKERLAIQERLTDIDALVAKLKAENAELQEEVLNHRITIDEFMKKHPPKPLASAGDMAIAKIYGFPGV